MPEISDDELKALNDAKAERDALKAEADRAKADKEKADKEAADKLKNKGGDGKPDPKDDDLNTRVRKEREAADKNKTEIKSIESALKFNLSVNDFVKTNLDVLPAEIGELLKAAEKESYDSAAEKANAVKTAFIQSFFAVQEHVDLLTANQKTALADYLKLTKNGKEARAEAIYENLFEPALETLKKVKKAEELGKARMGLSPGSKVDDAYKQKLMDGSKNAYMKKKGA